MLAVTLVRHGETAWNAEQRVQGVADVPLNATGQAQAQAVADALRDLPLRAVYASDLARARDTADAIAAPHSLTVVLRPALREMHQGALEGLTFAEMRREHGEVLQAWITDPADVVMPGGGESLHQVQERVWPALKEILAAHAEGHIAVVTHTLVLRCLIARILGMSLNHARRFHLDTAALTVLEVGGRLPGIALRTLNDTAHLRGLGPVDPSRAGAETSGP